MEITIGPYVIRQRTEYSKIQLFNKYNNENITDGNEHVLRKILDDYNKQTSDPEQYFLIEDDKLVKFKEIDTENIEYVFVPDKIAEIGQSAFENTDILYINLPDTLIYINFHAFYDCRNLKSIEFPDTVKMIGDVAFCNCYDLENIKFPQLLSTINTWTFKNCKSLKTLKLPENLKFISSKAFEDCIKLETIQWNENLQVIGSSAFSGCNNLTKIDLPKSVTDVHANCFANCTNLSEVKLTEDIRVISDGMFLNCSSLEHIELSSNLWTIEKEAFKGCNKLCNLTIPDTVSIIGSRVFANADKIERINIPQRLKSIHLSVFAQSSVKTIEINYDLNKLKKISSILGSTSLSNADLLAESNIDKIVIDSNVDVINAEIFKFSGAQITQIDYLGTKQEFEKFKRNNKELFDVLSNIEKINFLEEKTSEKLMDVVL